MPYMVSARSKFQEVLPTFAGRKSKLVEVVAAVGAIEGGVADVLQFVPAVPQVSMVFGWCNGVER